jgi:hypothetical protein
MVDEPDSIVLRYLRKMDEKLDRLDGRQLEMAGDLRSQAELAPDSSIASILNRLDTIERRLDLNS